MAAPGEPLTAGLLGLAHTSARPGPPAPYFRLRM
jgi:hypothetical protein